MTLPRQPRIKDDWIVRQDEIDRLRERIELIERRDLLADEIHKHLVDQDQHIKEALDDLSFIIKDPKEGLIVELRAVKEELIRDRKLVIGTIAVAFTLIQFVSQIFAPVIRHILGMPQ